MKKVIEINESGVCDSEGLEVVDLKEIETNDQYALKTFRRIFHNTELKQPVTFTLKEISDADWEKAQQVGDDLA